MVLFKMNLVFVINMTIVSMGKEEDREFHFWSGKHENFAKSSGKVEEVCSFL